MIIAVAVPTVITLTIFGIRGHHGNLYVDGDFYNVST